MLAPMKVAAQAVTGQVSETVKNPPEKQPAPLRVLEVDLEAGCGLMGSFESEWPELEAVASARGSALAWALQADAHRSGEEAPFVLAVGDAVRRGIPTAARVSVCGRGAHTGRITEGAVGGGLGRRLASVADALVLRGRAPQPGGVLVIDPAGGVSFSHHEEVETLTDWLALLLEQHPESAQLAVGPAAWRGVSYANLAVGEDPPSFVGRGGLGGTLAGMGIWGIVVEASEVKASEDVQAWTARLKRSPRLRERGAGGSLERAHEARYQGEESEKQEAALALARAGSEAGVGLRGCAGCPTPCGWVFETHDGARQGGRFNALDSVGLALGLRAPADALEVLAACDEVGVDAKEAGAALELWARARAEGITTEGPRLGELADFTSAIRALAEAQGSGPNLSLGAEGLAERFGFEAPTAQGEAVRPRHGLGGALAGEVAARGAEPMRTFAFLLEGGVPRARAQALVAPLKLSNRGLDPMDPAEKGRLVWWHENFVAGIDSTGFCAFSAAGALADGVIELEELAGELLGVPASRQATEALLATGASLTLLALEVSGGSAPRSPQTRGMEEPWEEYWRLRGVDEEGGILPEVAARIATPEVLLWEQAAGVLEPEVPLSGSSEGAGEVSFAAGGELGRALGGTVALSMNLPATLSEALEALTAERPLVRELLFVNGSPISTGWRDGERVDLDEVLVDGDHLDLVLAVGGG